jgi:hypothetical protein
MTEFVTNNNEDLTIPPDSYRDPTKTILSKYEK